MRIVDLIDIRIEQYRAFKSYLREGSDSLGVPCLEALSAEERADLQPDDIGIIPPYGDALNALRNGESLRAETLLMIDLKGPMGVDGALMVAQRHHGRFRYLSPILGQSPSRGFFAALHQQRVECFPLAFFPSARQIDGADLLAAFTSAPPTGDREIEIVFAGAVWGKRQAWITSLQAKLGEKLHVCDGLMPRAYRALLEGALGGLDFAGNHAHTYRFSELYLAGAVCLCEERSFFVLGRAPKPGLEISYFGNVQSLVDAARRLLNDPWRANELAAAGGRWFRETQNPARYVDYLIAVAEDRVRSPFDDQSHRPWEKGRPWSL